MKRRQTGYGGWCVTMRFLASYFLTKVSSAAITSTHEHPLSYSLDLGHRRLAAVDPDGRHDSPPARKRVKEEKETSRFSYYMVSDCKPRSSGYFGSTGGDPVLFQYGFELETTIFATMDRILNIINDRVMDEVISSTFSDMCGVHRRRGQESVPVGATPSSGRVTGFHFSSEEVVPSMTCAPQLNEKNTCSFYAGQVKVFGYNIDDALIQQLMGYARDALPLGLADAAQSGAVRVVLSDDLTKQLEGPGPSSASHRGGTDSASVGATAGLVLACSVLFISIGVLGAYYFTEVRRKSGKERGTKNGRPRNAIARYFDTGSLTNTYQVTESDDSEARAAARSLSRTSPSKGTPRSQGRSDRSDVLEVDAHDWSPIVVEFGPSFDPERDRYLQAMEELSSVPPSYAKHLAMSGDMSFRDLQIV